MYFIQINCTFLAWTLWLQGENVTKQPVEDDYGNILLWNGDILDGHNVSSS